MPMSKDVVIVVIGLLHLFGEENEFFLIFPFVRQRVSEFFQSAMFRPIVAQGIAQERRHAAVHKSRNRVVEECAQTNK